MELFISYFNIKQPNPFSARTIPLPSHNKLCPLGSTLGRQPLQHPHLFEAILSFRNMLQKLKYCTKRSSPLQNFVYSILVSNSQGGGQVSRVDHCRTPFLPTEIVTMDKCYFPPKGVTPIPASPKFKIQTQGEEK